MAKSLFGGCCSIEFPLSHDFIDVSSIRQVPDNQEVFVHSTLDATLIIEILESSDNSSSLASFHFNNIAEDNDSTNFSIHQTEEMDIEWLHKPYIAEMCKGIQSIKKFNQRSSEEKEISIEVGAIRISEIETDIVISFSCPLDCSLESEKIFNTAFKSFKIKDWSLFKPE